MDDKNQTGKADDSRINVNEDYELQYWSDKFGVSRERLREAVEVAGTSVEKVKSYLGG